jgi:hypothetical protein
LTLQTKAKILAASVSSYNLVKRKNRKTKAGRTIRSPLRSDELRELKEFAPPLTAFLAAA